MAGIGSSPGFYVVFALLAGAFFLIQPASATWWDTSWPYRMPITINGSTSALTDYQVLVNLTSSNFNFSRANSQGNDTRFTWLNGSIEQNVSFWIENWTASGSLGNATIWVKVPNVTASTVANTTLYMYYGNPNATYNNSLVGNNVFDFFDDFSGSSIDASKWTTSPSIMPLSPSYDHNGADWTLSNGNTINGTHYNISTFIIPTGATVYVQAYSGGQYGAVEIHAANAIINGTLDATGKGYAGGGPYGAGSGPGYGGNPAPAYGSSTAPVDLGSGAGSGSNGASGSGGGLIKLFATGTLTITSTGSIIAAGQSGSCNGGAGGSGGTIYISAGTFAGTGSITASGGSAAGCNSGTDGCAAGASYGGTGGACPPGWYQFGGGGGGGRVAVYYINKTYTGAITVAGGTSSSNAGNAGTTYDGGTYPWSVVSGELKSNYTLGRLQSLQTFGPNITLETKSRYITMPSNGYQVAGFLNFNISYFGYLNNQTTDYYANNGVWTAMGTAAPSATNLLTRISVNSSAVVALSVTNYNNGTSYQSASNIGHTLTNESLALGLRYDGNFYNQSYEAYWDWVRVRKYAAVEPSVLSIGAEQNYSLSIAFAAPTDSNNSYVSRNWTYVNITSSAALSAALLEWNGTNQTMQGSGTNWYLNKTSLAEGNYSYKVYGNNSAGNFNQTGMRMLTVDTVPPAISTSSPLNQTYTSSSIWFTATSNGANWVGYSLDGASNVTMANSSGNWNALVSSIANGQHYVRFYARDIAGNADSTAVIYFTVNSTISFDIRNHWLAIIVESGSFSPVMSAASKYAASGIGNLTAVAIIYQGYQGGIFENVSTTANSMTLGQRLENNNAYLVFTKGTWQTINDRMDKVVSGAFNSLVNPTFAFPLLATNRVTIGIDYSDKGINITGDMKVAPGIYTLIVRNEGMQNGRTVVSIKRRS